MSTYGLSGSGEPINFDNVRDAISPEDLQGLSEDDRAAQIVAWANLWFRHENFDFGDSGFKAIWEEALNNAKKDDKNIRPDRPPLSPREEEALRRIKERLVVIKEPAPFRDSLRSFWIDPADKDDFLRCYNHHRQQWLYSDQHQGLERVLEKARISFVNKIVAFGIGSPLTTKYAMEIDLSPSAATLPYSTRQKHRRRSIQYAALLKMAEFFEGVHGKPVEVYVQDPALQEADKDALTELGFKVMDPRYDHHEGFTKIDENTVVYDAIIDRDIFQIYMEYARPAAVMTPFLDGVKETRKRQDDDHYVIVKDERIEQGTQIAWLGPLYPSHPTDRTFCTLRHYYREYSLVGNKDQLPSEARKACTTSDATYRVLRALMETEQQAGPCHPEEMHDLNFSAQAQLSLYVRKS